MAHIDLIWLGDEPPTWTHGKTYTCAPTPSAVYRVLAEAATTNIDALLIWDARTGLPNADDMTDLLNQPGEVWHAGLLLGTSGKPGLLNFVYPTWMLNLDPAPDRTATSWRVSLRACLLRVDIVRQLGNIDPNYTTLAGAALEFGLRCIKHGAVVRHTPDMIAQQAETTEENLPLSDEVRLISAHYGRRWVWWSLLRAVMTGHASPGAALTARHAHDLPSVPGHFKREADAPKPDPAPRVSVIIPTLNRYDYLRVVLRQLAEQTVPPHEVFVVDQTAPANRDPGSADDFADLPLHWLTQESPGQCTARNTALQQSTGDYLLFIDDDDELEPDLIARHLDNLWRHRVNVSCGAVYNDGESPPEGGIIRVHDGFPTNNAMIRRAVLHNSGLFDEAYNRHFSDDHELGLRMYLAGEILLHNSDITVLHHHASGGGLRVYGQHTVTATQSRQSLTHRRLPSAAQFYQKVRYYSEQQGREADWIVVMSTFSGRGSTTQRILKALVSLALLPHTLWQLRDLRRRGRLFVPNIPQLGAPQTQPGVES